MWVKSKMKTVLLNEDLESRNVASGCGEKVKRTGKDAHIRDPCCEVQSIHDHQTDMARIFHPKSI